jgi:hypothetical protein
VSSPGPHTGIAVWFPDTDTVQLRTFDFTTAESVLTEDAHVTLWGWLSEYVNPYDFLICEKFEYDREKAQQSARLDYTAAEFVGVIKLYAYKNHMEFCYQTRGAVGEKAFWSDDKLRRLGLFKSGRQYRHEMDALRHLLYHATFCFNNQHWVDKLGKRR